MGLMQVAFAKFTALPLLSSPPVEIVVVRLLVGAEWIWIESLSFGTSRRVGLCKLRTLTLFANKNDDDDIICLLETTAKLGRPAN